MANYIFPDVNNDLAISNPVITVCGVFDKKDGTALVFAKIVEGNPSPNFSVTFEIQLESVFLYAGAQPMEVDVDAWFATEIETYEV